MAINERLIDTEAEAAAAAGNTGEEGLILHLDANDVDSYDGDGSVWYDIKDHEYKPTTNVSEHFNTVLYTGQSSAITKTASDIGFQPDLVWIKNRDGLYSHRIFDTVRGANERLLPDSTAAESTRSGAYSELSSFSDGFTVDANNVGINSSAGDDYVAWCFKAGGAAVSNTDGSITSSVSVNTDLGFSIAKYHGNATSGATVGHGLGVKPELIIVKNLDTAVSWGVWTTGIGLTEVLRLDQNTAATTPGTAYWTPQNNTGSVFGLGTNNETNDNSDNYIAYCFTSKRGVSKVGSYKGTGAAGNKVYTGFEPAWILVKETSSTGNWRIMDNVRDTNNPKDLGLWANLSNAESSSSTNGLHFNRDGFTTDSTGSDVNASGQNYIYLAFAKDTNETELYDTDLELHLDADSFPQKGESGYSNTPSTWTDSANSYNGTITNATFDSELGNYLEFNGSSNGSVTTTYDIPSSGAKTIEMWFNASSTQTDSYAGLMGGDNEVLWIGGNLTSSYSDESIYWYNDPSELGLIVREGEGKYLDNKWHHLAIVDTGSAHKMYVDGNEKSFTYSYGSASTRLHADNVKLGVGYNSNSNMTGKIGQFRIYSSALSQDQVRQNFNFTKNDYPNGFNGTISGATWNSGGYFDFDGSNDIVETQLMTKANTLRSYSFWFRTSSTSAQVIFDGNNSGSTSAWHHLYIDNTKLSLRLSGSAGDAANDSTNYCDNVWRHCVAICNAPSFKKLYINGTETASSTSFSTPTGSLVGLDIGHYQNTGGLHFNGDISQFKAYDKVLTTSEISTLFDNDKADYGY